MLYYSWSERRQIENTTRRKIHYTENSKFIEAGRGFQEHNYCNKVNRNILKDEDAFIVEEINIRMILEIGE